MATLQTYAEFQPTSHDVKGLGFPDQQDWLVCPCSICPNIAEPWQESNWEAQKKALEAAEELAPMDPAEASGEHGQLESFEICSFAHWATPFEIAIVRPGSKCAAVALELAKRLEDHPILDEDDLSERECEAQYESVQNELRSLTFERSGETLTEEMLADLASEICSNANDSEPMDRDDVKRALAKLPAHWVECIDDDTWRPEAETVPVDDLGEESEE